MGAATPCNPRTLCKGQGTQAQRAKPLKAPPASRNRRLLYCATLPDSPLAVLPLCTIMFHLNKSGNCPICGRFAPSSHANTPRRSDLSQIYNTRIKPFSASDPCTHGRLRTFLFEAAALIWLLGSSVSPPREPEIFKKLENPLNLSGHICKDRGKSSDTK